MNKIILVSLLWMLASFLSPISAQQAVSSGGRSAGVNSKQIPQISQRPAPKTNYYQENKPDPRLNNALLLLSGLMATFGLNLLIEPEELISLSRSRKITLNKSSLLENFSRFINRIL